MSEVAKTAGMVINNEVLLQFKEGQVWIAPNDINEPEYWGTIKEITVNDTTILITFLWVTITSGEAWRRVSLGSYSMSVKPSLYPMIYATKYGMNITNALETAMFCRPGYDIFDKTLIVL